MPERTHRGDEQNSRAPHPQRPQIPADVLEGLRRREPDALGRFFDLSFAYVYGLAFRLLGRRESAEDITQDVYLKVYTAADRLQADRDPLPWLTAITYNACRDAGRRASVRSVGSIDADESPELVAPGQGPDEMLVQKEKERILQEALLELDEPSRAAIVFHAYCGLSHEEVARALGMRSAGARKRYSRGLKRLAQIIGSRDL